MPAWIRVRIPGAGTFSQREDVPLHEDAVILDGVEALDPAGRPLPDIPEEPLPGSKDPDDPAAAAADTTGEPTTGDATDGAPDAAAAATTPGDDQAGTTTGKTKTKE